MAKTEMRTAPEIKPEEWTTIKQYTGLEGEAKGLADLYRRVYNVQDENLLTQTYYPYPEVFDPEWIDRTGKKHVLQLVRDTFTKQVIGAGTVLLDFHNQRGYVRGVMIDPTYQGKGLANYILVNAYRDVIAQYRDELKIFWTENRTAHAKSQKISELSGMNPVALLPNKDFFHQKRESDLLYILYSMNTLKTRRPEPTLIPEVMPIFERVCKRLRLDDAVPTVVPRTRSNGYEVKGSITDDKYNYHYCSFRACGKELKFEVNPRTQVAEKTWFSPDIDATTLRTLLKVARAAMHPTLYYMECYVSAFKPDQQQVFVDEGFKPTGYIPGWDVVDGRREDVVLMSWVQDWPALDSLALTRKAAKIARLFLS